MTAVLCVLFVLYIKLRDRIKINENVKIAVFALFVRFATVCLVCMITGKAYGEVFCAWDSGHYISIAENGYVKSGAGEEFIVFYPLYPLLIRIFRVLTGGYVSAGLLVSNIASVVGSIYFYKLMRIDMDESDSLFALALLHVFPFAFFMSGVYTESLFIMLCAMSFFYMRKEKFLVAAVISYFAALTRVQGILLFIPLLYEAFIKDKRKCAYALLPAAGFATYLMINRAVFGNAFKFMEYQKEIWYQELSWPGNNIENQVNYIMGGSELTYQIMIPQLVLLAAVCIVSVIALKKGMRVSYALYGIAYLFTVYSASWLLSGGRYILSLLPLYISAAYAVKNKTVRMCTLSVNILFQAVFAVMYAYFKQIM